MASQYAKCQSCAWTGEAHECLEVRGLLQRVAPGEPMPVGECPVCSALCQLVTEEDDAMTAHDKVHALAGFYYRKVTDSQYWPLNYETARREKGPDELAEFLAIEFREVMEGWHTWEETKCAVTSALHRTVEDLQSMLYAIEESTEKIIDELYQCRGCKFVCEEEELRGEVEGDKGLCPICAMTSYRIGRKIEE